MLMFYFLLAGQVAVQTAKTQDCVRNPKDNTCIVFPATKIQVPIKVFAASGATDCCFQLSATLDTKVSFLIASPNNIQGRWCFSVDSKNQSTASISPALWPAVESLASKTCSTTKSDYSQAVYRACITNADCASSSCVIPDKTKSENAGMLLVCEGVSQLFLQDLKP